LTWAPVIKAFMFGYATNESAGYMPLPISMAHKLVRTASAMRKAGAFPHARPDMKSQVTIDYTDSRKHSDRYRFDELPA
jgi:S-adenosylmethionine synthetase